jgi:hypothetical protein
MPLFFSKKGCILIKKLKAKLDSLVWSSSKYLKALWKILGVKKAGTKLAAYERELIGLVQAVRHWRPYLWGRAFVVRTDHYALKYMLDQRLSTVPQHQWISKLFGFDFRVEYKPGRLNVVPDALAS